MLSILYYKLYFRRHVASNMGRDFLNALYNTGLGWVDVILCVDLCNDVKDKKSLYQIYFQTTRTSHFIAPDHL